MTIKTIKSYVIPILTGGFILCVFSGIQKSTLGYPLVPIAFIVPFIAGGIGGFLYAIRFTQEKKHHKKIEEHNKKLRIILETVQSGIAIIDAKTMLIESINPAAQEIMGYNSSEIVGKKCCDYLCSDPSENCNLLNEKDANNYTQKTTIKVNNKNIPIIRKAKKVDLEDRSIVIVSMMDVSSILEIEEKLRQANERVRIADRLKTEFLTNVGHEIRTPLNAVIGISDLLIDDSDLPERMIEDISLIKNSGKSLLKTMENIMDYAMLKSGNQKIIIKPFDFFESIAFASSYYQDKAKEKGLTFEISIDNCIGQKILGDQSAFEKIFDNLLDNAVKFTETGGITIECQLIHSDETEFLSIKISDTGIGIPKDQWEYIFDAFYQIDGALNRIAEGTGMGLAVVDFYIQKMGGNIDVDSTIGSGTTFHLKIPKV